MKPQTKFALVLVTAYSVFMLWWFLREEAVKPSSKSPVTAATKAKKTAPITAVGGKRVTSSPDNFDFAPAGRVVAKVSAQHIQPAEIGAFKPYLYPGGKPYYRGEVVTAYVRVPSTKKHEALTVNQGGEFPRMMTQPGETVQVQERVRRRYLTERPFFTLQALVSCGWMAAAMRMMRSTA